MNIENYFWKCPNCYEKVDALKQLASLFDETGEADFAVEKDCGLWFHTIVCPKCEAEWVLSISGMERDEE